MRVCAISFEESFQNRANPHFISMTSTHSSPDALALSVVIVTMNRPDCVRLCLEHLQRQTRSVAQILVVDASRDQLTREVVAQFPGVQYLDNPIGYGHMTHSRNLGLEHTMGEVIAFIDDDSYAHPTWHQELIPLYADPKVGAVGGRALRGTRGEEKTGAKNIGVLHSNGMLSGNFGGDPGRDLELFHLVGCNMSFRRSVLAQLGGLREDYTGTEVREETDVCARVGKLGYKVMFAHRAVVDHVGAPQVKGQRTDLRYDFYSRRNHFTFLIRNFGPFSPIFWRFVPLSVWRSFQPFLKANKSAPFRFVAQIAGGGAGIVAGLLLWARTGTNPVRRDERGRQLSAILARREGEGGR